MKISVSENSNEPNLVQVVDEPAVVTPGVDAASLWLLFAILLFGIFVALGVFLMNIDFGGDSIVVPVEEPLTPSDSVEFQDRDQDGIIDTGPSNEGIVPDTP